MTADRGKSRGELLGRPYTVVAVGQRRFAVASGRLVDFAARVEGRYRRARGSRLGRSSVLVYRRYSMVLRIAMFGGWWLRPSRALPFALAGRYGSGSPKGVSHAVRRSVPSLLRFVQLGLGDAKGLEKGSTRSQKVSWLTHSKQPAPAALRVRGGVGYRIADSAGVLASSPVLAPAAAFPPAATLPLVATRTPVTTLPPVASAVVGRYRRGGQQLDSASREPFLPALLRFGRPGFAEASTAPKGRADVGGLAPLAAPAAGAAPSVDAAGTWQAASSPREAFLAFEDRISEPRRRGPVAADHPGWHYMIVGASSRTVGTRTRTEGPRPGPLLLAGASPFARSRAMVRIWMKASGSSGSGWFAARLISHRVWARPVGVRSAWAGHVAMLAGGSGGHGAAAGSRMTRASVALGPDERGLTGRTVLGRQRPIAGRSSRPRDDRQQVQSGSGGREEFRGAPSAFRRRRPAAPLESDIGAQPFERARPFEGSAAAPKLEERLPAAIGSALARKGDGVGRWIRRLARLMPITARPPGGLRPPPFSTPEARRQGNVPAAAGPRTGPVSRAVALEEIGPASAIDGEMSHVTYRRREVKGASPSASPATATVAPMAALPHDREAFGGVGSPAMRLLTERDVPALARRVYALLVAQLEREKRARGL